MKRRTSETNAGRSSFSDTTASKSTITTATATATRKKTASNHFSLKSVVAAAKTNSECHRRKQEQIDKHERDLMKLATEEVKRKQIHKNNVKRRIPYQRAHHHKQARHSPTKSPSSHQRYSYHPQPTSKTSTNNSRRGSSSSIENDNNSNSMEKPKIIQTDKENASQNKTEPMYPDNIVYFSNIAPGNNATGDDFLSHFKMEMNRGINATFGCPKLVKFEYQSNETFHKAMMEFSTPFEAQRVLRSTFCYYRGRPLTIELGSQVSSERLHGGSNSKTPGDTSRNDHDTTARKPIDKNINRSPGQAKRIIGHVDDKNSLPPSTTASPHENKKVAELHNTTVKSEDGIHETEHSNLRNCRDITRSNKRATVAGNDGVEIPGSPSTKKRRAWSGGIDDQNQDRDNRFSNQTLPPAPNLEPIPDDVLSFPPSIEFHSVGKIKARHTDDDTIHAERENKDENRIDTIEERFEKARKEIKDWKNSFALLTHDFKQEQNAKSKAQNALTDAIHRSKDLNSKLTYSKKREKEFQGDRESMRLEYEEKQKKLRKQYEELLSAKKAINVELVQKNHDLKKTLAELKSLRAEKDTLVENHSKLTNQLAKQSLMVETQVESQAALLVENSNLIGQIDVLTKDNKVCKEKLDEAVLQLEESLKTAGTNPSITNDAATTRLDEELKSKTKDYNELQQNFNTIAMQNFKQTNTIEQQREELCRLKKKLRENSATQKLED